MKVVVTDIEGTTSSVAFVKNVLFPYARRHMASFVRANLDRPDVTTLLKETRTLADQPGLDTEGVIRILIDWIDQDRKVSPLKELQGIMWANGYLAGDYRAHVYADAVDALRRWHAMGIMLYAYSSGSVAAQKLFFAYSEAGDLTPLFSGYFDTRVGPKRDAASYLAIARRVGAAPADIVFLSDVVDELDEAKAAGLITVLVCRDAPLLPCTRHPVVDSFASIDRLLEAS